MIKSVLEQAIKTIEVEKAQKIASIKDKVTREQIAPFNAEIDNARSKAIAELDTEMAQEISAVKVLAGETAVIASEYDKHIAKLNTQLAEINE